MGARGGLTEELEPLPRYDLMPQMGRSLLTPFFATVHAGGSVQHGLSTGGGDMGFLSMTARRINADC